MGLQESLRQLRHGVPSRRLLGLIVLDITKYFGPATGGIRTYLLEKARYAARRPGLRHLVVVPGARDEVRDEGATRWYLLRSPRIPLDRTYRFLLRARRVRAILEAERPDLIEVGSPFLVPVVARWANRSLRAPMVWFFHTNYPDIIAPPGRRHAWPLRQLRELAWRRVVRTSRRFEATLVASDSVARVLEARGVAKVERVTLGVDLDLFEPGRRARRSATRARYGLPEGPLALFVGRLAREKQLDVLLEAWRTVGPAVGATLLLVGNGRLPGPAPDASRWVRRLPYLDDRARLADLHAAADLYVAPGPAETFGLGALEAMACGTPVLTVDAGGAADRVRASGGGALYAPGDAADLSRAARELFASDLDALGARARAWAERHHAWDAAFDRIFEVYRKVLDRG